MEFAQVGVVLTFNLCHSSSRRDEQHCIQVVESLVTILRILIDQSLSGKTTSTPNILTEGVGVMVDNEPELIPSLRINSCFSQVYVGSSIANIDDTIGLNSAQYRVCAVA